MPCASRACSCTVGGASWASTTAGDAMACLRCSENGWLLAVEEHAEQARLRVREEIGRSPGPGAAGGASARLDDDVARLRWLALSASCFDSMSCGSTVPGGARVGGSHDRGREPSTSVSVTLEGCMAVLLSRTLTGLGKHAVAVAAAAGRVGCSRHVRLPGNASGRRVCAASSTSDVL